MFNLTLRRALLLSVAVVALVAMFAGLARLGVPVSVAGARAASHGPLFVLGVFFPLIALERAVAFGRRAGYVAPILGLVAGLGLVADLPTLRPVCVPAAAALVLLNASLWRKQASAHMVLMLAGSVSLLVGSLAWTLGDAVSEVVLCWMTFFVLTIVAERIELSRFVAPPRRAVSGLLGVSFVIAGLAAVSLNGDPWSPRAYGTLLALVGAWVLRYDLARRTLRQHALPRYAAVAALLGACWLCCSGVLLAVSGLPVGGPIYDAILHGVFVGFVLSMVFGHAPIILPAVARAPMPFHVVLYSPLLVLHGGLVARWGGDLFGLPLLRQTGGLLSALALVAFPVCAVCARRLELAGHDSDHTLGTQ